MRIFFRLQRERRRENERMRKRKGGRNETKEMDNILNILKYMNKFNGCIHLFDMTIKRKDAV